MRLYLMGICGTAMGNAALLARAAGHEVSGADAGVYPPMSEVLQEAGITVHEGYDPARLEKLAPDLVVVGNAMSRGNPEVEWLLEARKVEFTSLPAFLHDFVLKGRRNIVVCGTHGKTTTTSIAAFLLRESGRDPGYLIGGVPQDPPTGNHLGAAGDPFVIEGDEYDSAFFDKRSKFIHYAPHVAVLNNLEFDHADIFRDLEDVKRTFRHLTRIVPRNGWIVMNGDDENLRSLGAMPWTQVMRVGVGEGNDVRITDFAESGEGASFKLWWKGEFWAEVKWRLPGIFNARNAAMAAVACSGIRQDFEGRHETLARSATLLEAVSRFRGVKRRQEVLLRQPLLTVIEDFGHHPTAIGETLRSLRARFPGTTLAMAFEPRSNTARVNALQEEFAGAFGEADEVYLGPVNRPEKLKDEERFDVAGVAEQLRKRGVQAEAFPDNAQLFGQLVAQTLPPEGKSRVIVFFSNGSFDGIIGKYVRAAS